MTTLTKNSIALNRTLFLADNLPVLRGLDSDSIDLIATDPPFNKGVGAFEGTTKAGVNVEFKDVWTWDDVQTEWLEKLEKKHPRLFNMIHYANQSAGDDMGAFICWMGVRVLEMHRVLKDTGSIYLHCDPTASHYLKAMLDSIFRRKNFRNEIVWAYTGPSNTSDGFHASTMSFCSTSRPTMLHSTGRMFVYHTKSLRLGIPKGYSSNRQLSTRKARLSKIGGATSRLSVGLQRKGWATRPRSRWRCTSA